MKVIKIKATIGVALNIVWTLTRAVGEVGAVAAGNGKSGDAKYSLRKACSRVADKCLLLLPSAVSRSP